MKKVLIDIPKEVQISIWAHLLPRRFVREQAAFGYTQRQTPHAGNEVFRLLDWLPIPPEGFICQTRYHIQLCDEIKAQAIKRAHDLGASLVELHSHLGRHPAAFSMSDLMGFEEFVPHVWWRLKGRPYLAVVVCRSGFDGLVWIDSPRTPQQLEGIRIENLFIKPTRLSRTGGGHYGNLKI